MANKADKTRPQEFLVLWGNGHKQASADIPKELWLSIGQYQIKMVLGIIYGGCLGVSFWKVTHKLRLKGFRGTTL